MTSLSCQRLHKIPVVQNGYFPDSPFFPLKQLLQSQICSSSTLSSSCTPAGRAAPHNHSLAPCQGEGILTPSPPAPWQGKGILIPPPSGIWDRGSPPTSPPAPWQGEELPIHPSVLHPGREGSATGSQGHLCCQICSHCCKGRAEGH